MQYRNESHAVVEEAPVWTGDDRRGDALLSMWAEWAKSDPDRLGYPGVEPFAVVPGGKQIISDSLGEVIDAALTRTPAGSALVLRGYYLQGATDAFSQAFILSCIREFLNEYDTLRVH